MKLRREKSVFPGPWKRPTKTGGTRPFQQADRVSFDQEPRKLSRREQRRRGGEAA